MFCVFCSFQCDCQVPLVAVGDAADLPAVGKELLNRLRVYVTSLQHACYDLPADIQTVRAVVSDVLCELGQDPCTLTCLSVPGNCLSGVFCQECLHHQEWSNMVYTSMVCPAGSSEAREMNEHAFGRQPKVEKKPVSFSSMVVCMTRIHCPNSPDLH